MEASGNNRTALIVALLILGMAVSVLVTAYSYTGGSGIFPRFIGWIFLGLVLIECFVQLKVFISQPAESPNKLPEKESKKVLKEVKGFVWISFFLALIYLSGFLVGIPLYLFAFMRLSAGRSIKQCTIISVAATLFVYVLFIELLQYRLFNGLLFGA